MELNKIESIYFKTFFDLNIKILKNGEFYFNDIKYKNEDDFYSYLKETAGFYQDFILKELAGLNNDSKEYYLKAKIDKLKVHTDSLNFIKDTIEIKGKFNNLKTPYSTINVEFENHNKIEQLVLFDTIYYKIKVISLQILIAIGGHFRIINKGKEQLASSQNETNNNEQIQPTNQNLLNKAWFKIGLKFATGEAQKSYEKHKGEKGQFAIITKELGFNTNLRPYLSETINNTNQNDKNIYSNQKKLKTILIYCQSNEISVCPEFLALIQSE